MNDLPGVAVVIPTRNRADDVSACVNAVLANGSLNEVIVVDQSDDDATGDAVRRLADSRIRYIRTPLRGATNGRNVGIAATSAPVIAFTDDDCRVPADWVLAIQRIFATDLAAAVVCGRVVVPPHLQSLGFAATFEPEIREWQGRFPPPGHDWGITANLAVRRSLLEHIEPFDTLLGPGAPLVCGEEPDFLFRVLKAGFKIVNAREVVVEHLGVRPHGRESRDLNRAYAVGTGAAIFKHVRLMDPDGIRLFGRHLWGCARLLGTNLAHLRRPIGIGYTLGFLAGARESFRFGIDRTRQLYLDPRALQPDRSRPEDQSAAPAGR